MTTSLVKGRYKNYHLSSTESQRGEIVLVNPETEGIFFRSTDSNKKVSALHTPVLSKFNMYAQELLIKASGLAFDNGIHIFLKAVHAGYSVKVIDDLEDEEGIFIDFVKGENYRAFELYNDGAIIQINKYGTQTSTVSEHDTIQELNL